MSLLLQALKKAEEDKRRRAAGAEAVPESTEFPTLDLVEDVIDSADTNALAEEISAEVSANEWDFTLTEVELPAAQAALDPPESLDLTAQPIPETPAEPISQNQTTVPDSDVVEPVIAAAANPIPATPMPATAALKSTPEARAVAKRLFSKSPSPQGRGLLPWLVLGAGLLLAGMLAWFTWQYRQLTQASPNLPVIAPAPAPAPAVASAPAVNNAGYIAEQSAVDSQQVNTPILPLATPAIEKPRTQSNTNLQSAETKPISRARNDSSDLNLPLKFVRQTQNLSSPEPVQLAWQAYQNGDFAQAERGYRKVLLADPRQRDAILGLAAIAQQRGDLADAEALYRRLLRFNPQDEAAKAALLGLNSAQMPEKEAVQLEQSGKSDPMVLGHYFAAQQRWSQAQEQFFLAYTANPNSADAALNLAVSLDHLQQTSLALTYYRKALQAKEQINFDRSTVEQRIGQLDAAAGREP